MTAIVAVLLGACGGITAGAPAASTVQTAASAQATVAQQTATVPQAVATPAAPVATTDLDVSIGAPPPEGWRWVVAVIDTGAEEVVEKPNAGHDYFWVFYPLKVGTEVTTPQGTRLAPTGQAIMLPAKQEHSHRYPSQSRTLVFDVRSANDSPSAFHRGTKVLLSDKLLLTPASEYKLRIRSYTLTAGQHVETVLSDASLIYVVDGALSGSAGQQQLRAAENQAFDVPHGTKLLARSEGPATLRFLLVDVHP